MVRAVLILAATLVLTACAQPSADTSQGNAMAKITACPSKPNCVSSVATDETHAIEPLRFEGEGAAALARLKDVMAGLPRTTLVSEEDGYLHFVVTTRLMRFKDDVEFAFAEEPGRIDVRSASRVGHSDLGVNRKRVEEIRTRFSS